MKGLNDETVQDTVALRSLQRSACWKERAGSSQTVCTGQRVTGSPALPCHLLQGLQLEGVGLQPENLADRLL
eukprot:888277-Pelagomonas_calceolata.AAC.5